MIVGNFILEELNENLDLKEKDEFFRYIGEKLKKHGKINDSEMLFNLLKEREEQGSTYVGKSTAIPHIKCKALENFIIGIFKSEKGLCYGDNKIANVIIFVGGPTDDVYLHLKVLARIARMIKETEFVERILEESKPKNFKKIFIEEEKKIL